MSVTVVGVGAKNEIARGPADAITAVALMVSPWGVVWIVLYSTVAFADVADRMAIAPATSEPDLIIDIILTVAIFFVGCEASDVPVRNID
jgi:hypothetical protein